MHEFDHEIHSPEETLALLKYMVSHNRHHAEELHELGHCTSGDAARLIHEAVEQLNASTEKLEEAVALLNAGFAAETAQKEAK